MKKMLIAVLAVAGLASCTNTVEFEPVQKQIGLSPITQNRTRAMVGDTDFPTKENFMVWAWYKQLPAGTTITEWQADGTTQQTYINQKEFTDQKDGLTTGLWAGVTPYYWPKLGSLLFAGYYPTSVANVSYDFTATTNVMTIANYSPTDATYPYKDTGFVKTDVTNNHSEDLMYFKMTAASCNSGTLGSEVDGVNDGNSVTGEPNVDVVFQHALAWIKVTLAKAEDTPDDATITVSSVKFTGVNTTGTGTVADSNKDGEVENIVWVPTTATADIEVLDTPAILAVADDDAATVAKQPIVIPQAMTGDLVITYTIASTDGSVFEEVKTIALSTLKDNAATPNTINKWEAGKCYTYAIAIGTSEILIDPKVTDWAEVEIPVEIK